MKEIIHNDDNLTLKDITETVIRIKVLLINNGKIFIGNANNVFKPISTKLFTLTTVAE